MKSREMTCVVLIASQNASIRKRWKQELKSLFLVQTVLTVPGLYRMMARINPSLLLLDLSMIGLVEEQVILHILRISPSTKILAFSQRPNGNEALNVLKAGTKGYCDLRLDLMLLRKAIQMIQKGELWINRNFVTYVLNEIAMKHVRKTEVFNRGLNKLTDRERQIAIRIATGASNKEIAGQLNIRETTVKAHLTNIFLKVGVTDRLGLVLYLLRPQLPTFLESFH